MSVPNSIIRNLIQSIDKRFLELDIRSRDLPVEDSAILMGYIDSISVLVSRSLSLLDEFNLVKK